MDFIFDDFGFDLCVHYTEMIRAHYYDGFRARSRLRIAEFNQIHNLICNLYRLHIANRYRNPKSIIHISSS